MNQRTNIILMGILVLLMSFFLLFSYGRWTVPFAIWISIPLLLRTSRYLKYPLFIGLLLPILFGVNLIVWKNIIPLPVPTYQIICFISALFFIIPLFIDKYMHPHIRGFLSIIIYPVSLVVFLFLYHKISPAGTFGSIAYTQNNLYLLQILSITGIWGIIFMMGLLGSMLNHIYENYRDPKEMRKVIALFIFLFIVPVGFGVFRIVTGVHHDPYIKVVGLLNEFHYSKPIKDNVSEFDNISIENQHDLLNRTVLACENGANIIIWQETALLVRHAKEDHLIRHLSEIAKENHVHIGAPIMAVPDDYPDSPGENKVLWINSDGEIAFEYIKAYPTPDENIVKGEAKVPWIKSEFGKLSLAICFDMNFPKYIQQVGKEEINLFFVPANDWLEITPYHAKIAGFRAIEHGFNLFRITSNGYSVANDCYGRELAGLDSFKEDFNKFCTLIPLTHRKTLYSIIGDLFVWICTALLLFIFIRFMKSYYFK